MTLKFFIYNIPHYHSIGIIVGLTLLVWMLTPEPVCQIFSKLAGIYQTCWIIEQVLVCLTIFQDQRRPKWSHYRYYLAYLPVISKLSHQIHSKLAGIYHDRLNISLCFGMICLAVFMVKHSFKCVRWHFSCLYGTSWNSEAILS